jgi:hypothetical protein
MAPTNEQIAIAASIDKERSAYPDTAGGMEQLLVNMYKYVPEFKRILDTAAPGALGMFCEQTRLLSLREIDGAIRRSDRRRQLRRHPRQTPIAPRGAKTEVRYQVEADPHEAVLTASTHRNTRIHGLSYFPNYVPFIPGSPVARRRTFARGE